MTGHHRAVLLCAALATSFSPLSDTAPLRLGRQRRRADAVASDGGDVAASAGVADGVDAASSAPRTRRKRYAGRYPRNFADRHKERSGDAATISRVLEKGGTPAGTHVPIMVAECLEHLQPQGVVVDCTLGYGGHSSKLLEALPSGARLLAFDRDGDELSKTTARLADSRFESVHANYANVGGELRKRSLRASSLLADLGCSSMQIDDPTRGFTFKRDGPLDMRMDVSNSETAADWLRRASTSDVAAALRSAADFSRRDARELAVAVRREPRPTTTTEFADRVRAVQLEEATVGDDAVKRAMQAARVAVNDEFAALDELLASLPDVLAPGGRAVFLTFHSGEDRRVKKAFKAGFASGAYSDITRRPVRASPAERRANSRSGCCKLRWCVRAVD